MNPLTCTRIQHVTFQRFPRLPTPFSLSLRPLCISPQFSKSYMPSEHCARSPPSPSAPYLLVHSSLNPTCHLSIALGVLRSLRACAVDTKRFCFRQDVTRRVSRKLIEGKLQTVAFVLHSLSLKVNTKQTDQRR